MEGPVPPGPWGGYGGGVSGKRVSQPVLQEEALFPDDPGREIFHDFGAEIEASLRSFPPIPEGILPVGGRSHLELNRRGRLPEVSQGSSAVEGIGHEDDLAIAAIWRVFIDPARKLSGLFAGAGDLSLAEDDDFGMNTVLIQNPDHFIGPFAGGGVGMKNGMMNFPHQVDEGGTLIVYDFGCPGGAGRDLTSEDDDHIGRFAFVFNHPDSGCRGEEGGVKNNRENDGGRNQEEAAARKALFRG